MAILKATFLTMVEAGAIRRIVAAASLVAQSMVWTTIQKLMAIS